MTNVIGPIDPATWYCMRQCREVNGYLKTLKDPIYEVEIKGNEGIYNHFMDEVLNRKKEAA